PLARRPTPYVGAPLAGAHLYVGALLAGARLGRDVSPRRPMPFADSRKHVPRDVPTSKRRRQATPLQCRIGVFLASAALLLSLPARLAGLEWTTTRVELSATAGDA